MTVVMGPTPRYQWQGLSGDTKPTDQRVGINDIFFETDTGNFFIFGGSAWAAYNASSGGAATSITFNPAISGLSPLSINVQRAIDDVAKQTLRTPYDFGALGGAADDTVALLAWVASGKCVIPFGEFFNCAAALVVPDGGIIIGFGLNCGINFTNAAVPGIQCGTGIFTGSYTSRQIVRDFKVTGVCTVGVFVKHATHIQMDNILSAITGAYGFDFADTFGCNYTNLSTNESGGGVGFTGSCFRFRDGFNANYLSCLYTSNTNEPYAFYIGNSAEVGAPSVITGNVIDVPIAQGTLVGIYLGEGINGLTINGYYSEQVKNSLLCGTTSAVDRPHGVVFNGGVFCGARSAIYGGTYMGEAIIDIYQGTGITFNAPIIQARPHSLDVPITLTGGGGSGGLIYPLIKPDGTIGSLLITNPGDSYATAPTLSFGGSGTAAAGTCTVANGKIVTVTLTNAGSGYTRTTPVAVRYLSIRAVTFHDPQLYLGGAMWPMVVKASGATTRGGITIFNDLSITQPPSTTGSGGNADVFKTDDNTSRYYVTRMDDTGSKQLQSFVPAVYP